MTAQLTIGGYSEKGATLSGDGLYRYTLTRAWAPTGTRVCWVMLNPSTADATENDATIRRCIGFSRDWGHAALVVVNLFALRSTDPSALYKASTPIGLDNDGEVRAAARGAALVVAAWGAHGTHLDRGAAVRRMLEADGVRLHHLGLTQEGHPKHPLRLPKTTRPQPWSSPFDGLAEEWPWKGAR